MEELKWLEASDGEVPENAVEGGNEGDVTLFVGRATLYGDTLPGKVIESQWCSVSYGCDEHQVTQYQVLVNDTGVTLEWVPSADGTVPEDAVQGGETVDGEVLYVGRGIHENNVICGKVHPSHNCLYVAYGEGEHAINEYEVLVCKSNE